MTSPLEGGRRPFVPENIQQAFIQYADGQGFINVKTVPQSFLLITSSPNATVRSLYSWKPENPPERQFQPFGSISLLPDLSSFEISINADNVGVSLHYDSEINLLNISFTDNEKLICMRYQNGMLADLSYEEEMLVVWGAPVNNCSEYDDDRLGFNIDGNTIKIARTIDERDLFAELHLVLEAPQSDDPNIDDGWKMFNYRKFVGLEWSQRDSQTAQTE